MTAVIRVAFDPELGWGPLSVRWEAIALAVIVGAAVLLWVRMLSRGPDPVRLEDALFVLLGIVPGAVVVGRLVHGLAYADAYVADPLALMDLTRGSLSLLGAVVGGALSGAYVCRLLGLGVERWADGAAIPLLVAIGAGKVALLLGGGGLGGPSDLPWALAFDGAGPWIAADPGTPAHPASLYEGLLTLIGIPLIARFAQSPGRTGTGTVFLAAFAWWLGARAVAGLSWRDESILGLLGAEQLAALIALGLVLLLGAAGPVRWWWLRSSTS
ncbi:MAG: prolipoprotein diacylglyceryl transferase [Chloroflexi bacterium]|nr:prolipoprotein diacylglyceryl transferase [Chloroflexota bacterium]